MFLKGKTIWLLELYSEEGGSIKNNKFKNNKKEN